MDAENATQNENVETKTEQESVDNTEQKQPKEKTYTLDDLKKNGSQAAKNAVDEFKEKEMPKLIKAELAKQQEEQNMTAQQLADKRAEEREADLAKREAKISATEQRNLAISILSENNLSTDFAKYLVGQNDEETKAKVAAYISSVTADVKSKVNGYAKGKQDPPARVDKLNHSSNQKNFKDMSFEERLELHRTNPAKYEELKKGAI
ncbi:capsid assembly scaffolding protein Gp46 family protein [Lactobacillus bombicola]|uniref:capsid assembly scaffolding protein Gp46 family protein n=1 Tax=Lactobacillus bombicola TaxID=1505723 RepID=UPI000E582E33|nr:DUF4355 domain-containing protein [Lactobacillus bombicola]RHW48684.1 hypothetical protein DS833_07505 [Lactobacillus bombicola]